MPSEFERLGGWLGSDATQQAFAAQFPLLRDVAPQLYGDADDGEPILLYKAYKDVLGAYPEYVAQKIGSCVGHGFAHANDCLQCVEISLGEASEYRETSAEFIYAASREVAGILGRQDGSYGSAAVKAAQQIGLASREMLGSDGADSGQIAKDWGLRGVPAKYKEAATKFKLGSAAKVTTWNDLVAANKNGYPVTIASNQGFTLTRDAQGFCRASGSWAHQMHITGVRFDRPGALIVQSWGMASPTGPTTLDQPSYSFWADRSVVERILGQGDSWAISGAPDFIERHMPAHWSYGGLA